jgi:hypothetical protein
MSKRRRNPAGPQAEGQIEWLKHRTGYPSPEEREQIIRIRQKLSAEVILLGLSKVSAEDRRYRALVDKYGAEEILRAERKLREGMDTGSRVADDARSYREYRLRYSHFGAGLKYYSAREVDDLYDAYFEQIRENPDNEDADVTDYESKLAKPLLIGWRDWDDITPPAIPPRPADYVAPQAASYAAPINELLDWGDNLHRSHQFADETEYLQWKRFIPALTRMALDPGLRNGWPSEKASWAPWHAIHALGNLQAWESAPALAELADLENDWLSDHLPHIWADMGLEVEPVLWMILETRSSSTQQRGLAAEGLFMMTDENEAMSDKAIHGFEKILRNTSHVDPTLNGYLVMFLNEMEISGKTRDAIYKAFEENRVDTSIISPEDLEEEEEAE